MNDVNETRREVSQRSFTKRAGYKLLQALCRAVGIFFFGYRCIGRERYPATGGAVVCSNHQSNLDPVLVGMSSDRRLNYLARQTLFDRQPLKGLIEFLDAIPIDRDGFGLAGIKETLRRLKREEMVLVFPEGTRTHDGELQPLKPGICSLARRGRVPLVPVGVDGAFQAWPRGSRFPRFTRIRVVIGEPICPDEVARLSDDELLEELGRRMADCFQEARTRRAK